MGISVKPRARRKAASRSRAARATSEFDSHIQQIRANLEHCGKTKQSERDQLEATLNKSIGLARSIKDTGRKLRLIYSRLGDVAKSKDLFFKGGPANFVTNNRDVVHTKAFGWFSGYIYKGLAERFDRETAEVLTDNICAELRKPESWRISTHSSTVSMLPIHVHGFPFWVADPMSSDPSAETVLPLYPARAGLEPEPGEYVLLRLRCDVGYVPRFADSRGYPYWRPGGKTFPINGCPAEYLGFDEAVVDRVCLGHLSDSIVTFDRSI